MKLKKIISLFTAALVLTTAIPITDVSAAVKPNNIKLVTNANKKKSRHTLALGEIKSIKSVGKATVNVRFSPKNSSKGFRLTSDDASVVKVEPKNSSGTSWTMTGMGPGSANINVRSAVKSSLKTKLFVTVVSKAPSNINLSKSALTLLPNETGTIGAMNSRATVNVTFNNTKVDRFLDVTSSDPGIVSVNKNDNKNFTLQALKAGTANIKVASATNSNIKADLTVTVKSTEKPLSFTAKQSKKNQVLVTFAQVMTSTPSLNSFKLRQKGAGWDVALSKITMSSDGKSAYLDTVIDLTKNTPYELSFTQTNGQTETTEFTSSDNKPVKITLNTKTAVVSIPKKISYSLIDANGVDMSDVDPSRVTIEVDPRLGYYDSVNKTVTLFQVGTTANVKLTYHTYEYQNGVEQTLVSTGTITALSVSDIVVSLEKAVIKDGPGKLPDTNWNSASLSALIPAMTQNAYLAVRVKSSENELYASDATYNNISFSFESKNPDILTIDNTGKITLMGNAQAGKSATIVITVLIEGKKFQYTIPINIAQQSMPTSVILDPTNPMIKISANQPLSVQIKIMDQYGLDITKSALNQISITPKIQYGTTIPSVGISGPVYNDNTKKATFTLQANPGSTMGMAQYDVVSLTQQNRVFLTFPVIVVP